MDIDPNSSANSIQNNPVVQPPTPKKDNLLLIIIAVLLLAILGVGIFIAVQLLFGQNNKSANKVNKVNKQNSSNQGDALIKNPPQNSPNEQKKIAYVINNSIRVINADGTGRMNLTDQSGDEYYPNLAWKNTDELSYILCFKNNCSIKTSDLKASPPTIEANPGENAGDTKILSLTWNHAGDQLAYIYKLPDGQMRMDFKSGAVKNVVKTFASLTAGQGGRGGSLDDSVSIYFSPDDKYVLVTNTLGQPTVNDKSTIWVFDSSGKEVLDIKSDTNTWATQATWPNNTILFKQGTELYQRDIFAPNSVKIGSISNFYNPISIAGIEKVFYWGTTNSLPYIGLYTGLDHKSTKFLEGYYKPNILDDARVVAIKAQKAPEGKEAMFPYVSGGISKIDLRDKKVTDLDSGDINMFAVSP